MSDYARPVLAVFLVLVALLIPRVHRVGSRAYWRLLGPRSKRRRGAGRPRYSRRQGG